ncbi:hypothetical protein L195_g055942, partial [Trifolium pratense]
AGEFGRQLALDSIKSMHPAFSKKGAYDPIDYERIDDIEFWIMEEDTTPILDSNEIESMFYNEESVPIVGLDNEEGENEILMCIELYYGIGS